MTKLKKTVKAYGRIFQKVLKAGKIDRREEKLIAYMKRLTGMYRSELFKSIILNYSPYYGGICRCQYHTRF